MKQIFLILSLFAFLSNLEAFFPKGKLSENTSAELINKDKEEQIKVSLVCKEDDIAYQEEIEGMGIEILKVEGERIFIKTSL
ncbi:MAG: hypothetical protein AB1630_11670, partial [bacterium]